MTSGWVFLALNALICAGVFLNGWRFSRMTQNPWGGKTLFGLPVEGHDLPIEKIRRFGIMQMVFAPLFLALVAALCFGLLGPVNGIETIRVIR